MTVKMLEWSESLNRRLWPVSLLGRGLGEHDDGDCLVMVEVRTRVGCQTGKEISEDERAWLG